MLSRTKKVFKTLAIRLWEWYQARQRKSDAEYEAYRVRWEDEAEKHACTCGSPYKYLTPWLHKVECPKVQCQANLQ